MDCTATETSFLEVLIKMANGRRAEKDPTHKQQLDQFPGAHLQNRTLLLYRRAACLPLRGWNKSRCLDNAGLNSYKGNCLPHSLAGPLSSLFPDYLRFGLHRIEKERRDFTSSVEKIVLKRASWAKLPVTQNSTFYRDCTFQINENKKIRPLAWLWWLLELDFHAVRCISHKYLEI